MCTIIPLQKQNHPQIAEEDIIVYKLGYRSFREIVFTSELLKYSYLPGEVRHASFSYDTSRNISPMYYGSAEGTYRDSLKNPIGVCQGFHALTRLTLAKHHKISKSIGRFTIPKGSKYYKNPVGHIVSDTIIFNEFI